MTRKRGKGVGGKSESNFEGILRGLGGLLEKIGELADKGEKLSQAGEFDWKGKPKNIKGIYGFSVKVGGVDKGIKVEPFGNIRKSEENGRSFVHETREPIVDVFEEKDHTLVVVELPGISTEDTLLDLKDDLLTIHAEKGDKKYHKEVLLPQTYTRDHMHVSCNNGILEIKFLN